jgi:hypothetical protein
MRTHENYREVFPLLKASFHGRSRGRCGPRERSSRSTREQPDPATQHVPSYRGPLLAATHTRRRATVGTVLDRHPGERRTTGARTGVGVLDRRGRGGSPHPGNRSCCAAHCEAGPRSGSHLGSHSLRNVDVHGRPNRVGDLLEHPGRSVLNCGSQTSKAREGSRPPWVQIPPLPPSTRRNAASSLWSGQRSVARV